MATRTPVEVFARVTTLARSGVAPWVNPDPINYYFVHTILDPMERAAELREAARHLPPEHATKMEAIALERDLEAQEAAPSVDKSVTQDARCAWSRGEEGRARVEAAIQAAGLRASVWYKGSYRRVYASGGLSKNYYVDLENRIETVTGNYRCPATVAMGEALREAADRWFDLLCQADGK